MPAVYIGPWTWDTSEPSKFWRGPRPDLLLGLIDLRSLPQCGSPGVLNGPGLFVLSSAAPGIGVYIGSSLQEAISSSAKRATARALSLGEGIVGTSLLDIIVELLTQHADPTGLSRWRPLMPGFDGRMQILLGGFSPIYDDRWDVDKHPLVLPTLQFDYKNIRDSSRYPRKVANWLMRRRAANVPRDQHLRYLAEKENRLGLSAEELLSGSGLPYEGRREPHTTITESFNTTDGDILGPLLSWTEVAGDTDIVTNKASLQTTGTQSSNRAESALSTDDHYAQAATPSGVTADTQGVAGRFQADAHTLYRGEKNPYFDGSNLQRFFISKLVTGTRTLLVTGTSGETRAAGTLKFEADGSAIEVFHDGVSKGSGTDTAITGNLYTGISGLSNGANRVTWDDFEAADLSALYTQAVGDATITPSGTIVKLTTKTMGGATVTPTGSASTVYSPGVLMGWGGRIVGMLRNRHR